MPGIFPTRHKPWWQYLPLVSIAALFWWITGLGLWIHYTYVAYSRAEDLINILQLSVAEGPYSEVQRIYSSMISTSVVYAIFAIFMHALGLWRGLEEQRQDSEGHVDEDTGMYILWINVAIQIAWWVITFWLLVMGVGFGVFAGMIYIVKSSISNTLLMQALAGTIPPPIRGYCASVCLDVSSTGIFFYSKTAEDSITFCVCDQPTLQAAFSATQAAYDAVPGMIVGMLLMTAYGVVLLTYLVNMMVRINTEQGVSDRLMEQGFLVGATVAKTSTQRR